MTLSMETSPLTLSPPLPLSNSLPETLQLTKLYSYVSTKQTLVNESFHYIRVASFKSFISCQISFHTIGFLYEDYRDGSSSGRKSLLEELTSPPLLNDRVEPRVGTY